MSKTKKKNTNAMDGFAEALALLGDDLGITSASISDLFGRIDIAEHEIAAAKARHRDKGKITQALLHESFALLTPTRFIKERDTMLTDNVYAAYCRELLDRVARGEDVNKPTQAEIALAFMAISLKGPLSHNWFVAYMRVFSSLFPEEYAKLPDSTIMISKAPGGWPSKLTPGETYAEAAIGIINDVTRKLQAVQPKRLG